MIRPRPTVHVTAEPLGMYTMTTVVHHNPRPAAWCPCGAKLSVYRPIGSSACWACESKAVIDAETLHPEVLVAHQRQARKAAQ